MEYIYKHRTHIYTNTDTTLYIMVRPTYNNTDEESTG